MSDSARGQTITLKVEEPGVKNAIPREDSEASMAVIFPPFGGLGVGP